MEQKKLMLFLSELSELSRKHGLYIDACGCCNGPWVLEKDRREGEPYPPGRYTADEDGDLLTWEGDD